jgi:carboxylesterase type B
VLPVAAGLPILASCAMRTTASSTAEQRISELQKKLEQVAAQDEHCTGEAVIRAEDDIARLAKDNLLSEAAFEAVRERRDRQVSLCEGEADRENSVLTAMERDAYEQEAEEARDRASLMMTLMTRHP